MFLVRFLQHILEAFYTITASYGSSIILLSLTVTIIMLPLFWIAEKIQNKERIRKTKMQPALDQIKDVDNKQERYYYTQEIYRKNSYSPFYSLTGLFGLLIQVPFFIAAYWMILEYLPLKGMSFGPIDDLYKSDKLISLGGISFNLLPFLMTSINLIAIYLFAKDRNEKIQLVIIALVFLFLLYDLSSALVLYWTMNNAFAIGKNWLMSKIKFKNNALLPPKIQNKINPIWKRNKYLIFPLMFSIFPLLSSYLTNIGEIYFTQIFTLLLIVTLSSFLLLIALKVFFKDKNKTLIFSGLTTILFFSYGHIVEPLRDFSISHQTLSLLVMILYILILIGVSYFLLKSKKDFNKITKGFKVLSVCLFSIVTVSILTYNVRFDNSVPIENESNSFNTNKDKELTNYSEQYPDIYYVILDGYANSGVLKDVLGYDNSSFDNSLKERGFYLASESRCNYVATFLSLASTLNMKHINYLSKDLGKETKSSKVPAKMITNNKVTNYLKDKGYKTVHFRSGWGITEKNDNSDYIFPKMKSVNEFTTTFLQTTVLLPIINRLTLKSYSKNILFTLNNISKLEEIKEPKFVFGHIVSPHPPYIFDKNGNEISKDIKFNNEWDLADKKYYLDQLEFINKKTINFIDEILKKSDSSVIIIQSDHGSAFLGKDWNNPDSEFIRERSKILNAILLNTNGEEPLYQEISSVNTFRVVFNTIFNANFELLKDSTFFSSYDKPYDFINVTESINNKRN